jgi:hypothetical protein
VVRLLSHSFYTNAPFIREKHENLVGRVVVGRGEEVELVPTGKHSGTSTVGMLR